MALHRRNLFLTVCLATVASFVSVPVLARSVFLNGIDVSSARSQELRHVQVRINERGDIFISAPHYQVTEEDFFTPLSRVNSNDSASKVAESQPASVPSVEVGPAVAAGPSAGVKSSKIGNGGNSGNAGNSANARGFGEANMGIPATYRGESMPPVIPATPPATGTTPVATSESATQNAE